MSNEKFSNEVQKSPLRKGVVCALKGEYKGSFNGKDNQRVKVSYARSNDPKH